MKHSGPEDDYLYEELEESDDYVYLDEDDDARSAQGSGAVAVLGVIAALCALALVGVIVASIVAPSLFRSKTSDDPDAILHSLHLEQEQELKENPQVQGSTEPTTEPTIPPEANPFDQYDFQYNKHNYLYCLKQQSYVGVDVSAFQHDIDWKAVKASGVDLGIFLRHIGGGRIYPEESGRLRRSRDAHRGVLLLPGHQPERGVRGD